MARETKQERKVREEAELKAAFEKVSAGWAVRFADAMTEFANLPGFTVEKSAGGVYKFSPPKSLMGYNHHYEVPAVLTFEFFYDGLREIEEAEYAVTRYKEEQAESARKYKVYQSALSRLNPEEQELLKLYWGVNGQR